MKSAASVRKAEGKQGREVGLGDGGGGRKRKGKDRPGTSREGGRRVCEVGGELCHGHDSE